MPAIGSLAKTICRHVVGIHQWWNDELQLHGNNRSCSKAVPSKRIEELSTECFLVSKKRTWPSKSWPLYTYVRQSLSVDVCFVRQRYAINAIVTAPITAVARNVLARSFELNVCPGKMADFYPNVSNFLATWEIYRWERAALMTFAVSIKDRNCNDIRSFSLKSIYETAWLRLKQQQLFHTTELRRCNLASV